MRHPNPALALARYRNLAAGYDRRAESVASIRRRAVERLGLVAGGCVLDVACGTGLSFAPLLERVGPEGQVIGIDQSAEMLAVARRRVATAGWANVTLIESPMETAQIPPADAVLFHFTQDVLSSKAALHNVFSALRPGARVVVAGAKFFPWWLAPLNLLRALYVRRYAVAVTGFYRPWRLLEDFVEDMTVEPLRFGSAYVVHGKARGATPPTEMRRA